MINAVFNIVKKEVITILRDKLSMLILLGLPAIIIIVLGHVLRFEIRDVGFVVMDNSQTSVSRHVIEEIDVSECFRFAGYINAPQNIEKSLIDNDARVALVFPDDFGRQIINGTATIELFIDASDMIYADAIEYTLNGILSGASFNNILYRYNPILKKEVVPVPGLIMIVFIIVASIMLSMSVNRERERGTSRLLVLAPVSINGIIAGKAIPYIVISLFHSFSVMIVSRWFFDIKVEGEIWLFLTACTIFILNSMAFGLLIAAWVRSEVELLIGCWLFLFIPNVFFSGFIFPLQTMSQFIRPAASLLPGTLFIELYKGIVYRASGFLDNRSGLILLTVQSLIVYSLAIKGFKNSFYRK